MSLLAETAVRPSSQPGSRRRLGNRYARIAGRAHRRIAGAAAFIVRQKFCEEQIVPEYLQLYEDVLA